MEMNETCNWFQAQIPLVYKPTYLNNLSNGFRLKGNGKVKASQWRVFGEIYGPLIVPWLWWSSQHTEHPLPDNELKTLLKLFAAIRYMFTNNMSDTRLDTLEKLIQDFINLSFKLHPEVAQAVTNFHVFKHIPDDIRRFGPVYGYWLFPHERVNKVLKSINTNGPSQNQEQVEQMRGFLRKRQAERIISDILDPEYASSQTEREVQIVLEECLLSKDPGTHKDKADQDLEVMLPGDGLSSKYAFRAIGRPGVLPPFLLSDLRLTLRRLSAYFNPEAVDGLISNQDVTFYPHLSVRGYRFDAADPTLRYPQTTLPYSEVVQLFQRTNSMVEVRQPTNFFNDARDTRTICILMTIFSKQVEKFGIETDNEFFGIFRTLHPASGWAVGLINQCPDGFEHDGRLEELDRSDA
ncbi:hypothetical protein D1P53_004433 [Cryptococcus gattii VGV]|nr:hypothetical protein D1P53_004433 [Cryptococcus gattii VGV]